MRVSKTNCWRSIPAHSLVCWLVLVALPQTSQSESHGSGHHNHRLVTSLLGAKGIHDVRLTTKGEIQGRVIDQRGNRISGFGVELHDQAGNKARVTTDEDGWFRCKTTRGGLYRVAIGDQTKSFRCWTAMNAPPSSLDQINFIVVDQTALIGQRTDSPSLELSSHGDSPLHDKGV